MKIISVRDKRLRKIVENDRLTSVKGLDALEFRKISEMIAVIRVMTHPRQLLAKETWKAHELTPGQPGTWSMTVTRNWRLTFFCDIERQEVSLLDYVDYH